MTEVNAFRLIILQRSLFPSRPDRCTCGLRSGAKTILASASLYSMAPKPITSPVPIQWYPALSAFFLLVGLSVTAFFFIYEATTSSRNRSMSKELVTAAVASTFLGFGSLFLLLATGVYV